MKDKVTKKALPIKGEGYVTGSTNKFVRRKEDPKTTVERKSVFDRGVRSINLNLNDSKLRQKNPFITREQFKQP